MISLCAHWLLPRHRPGPSWAGSLRVCPAVTMPRALRVCPEKDCPTLTQGGPCAAHKRQRDTARGTAAQRGYNSRHWRTQRRACLRRDPICTCVLEGHDHAGPCWRQATVADHDPHERKDLVAQGVPDPDALCYLKGKCKSCHDRKTAATAPGGWHGRHGG